MAKNIRYWKQRFLFISIVLFIFSAAVAEQPPPERPELKLFIWYDYLPQEVLDQFTAETGITVKVGIFDTDERLEAELLLGASGYDVVVPSANPFFARQIQAGVYQPLQKNLLTNYGNLSSDVLKTLQTVDPENQYGVPYFWGTVGIAYNRQEAQARLGDEPVTWDTLFDPEKIKKFKDCGVAWAGTPIDTFGTILKWQGKDPNSTDPKDFEGALEVMRSIRPYIHSFPTSEVIEDLVRGDVCLAFMLSGDALMAKERAATLEKGPEIKYIIPYGGTQMWVDVLAIPKDAPHPQNAHKFINFILRPDVICQITKHVRYANPNDASEECVDPELLHNPHVYPSLHVMSTLYMSVVVPTNFERKRTRAWIRVKSTL